MTYRHNLNKAIMESADKFFDENDYDPMKDPAYLARLRDATTPREPAGQPTPKEERPSLLDRL